MNTIVAPYWHKLSTGGTVLIHPCSVCGMPNAGFGYGVSLKKDRLGTWYCADHRPNNTRKGKDAP